MKLKECAIKEDDGLRYTLPSQILLLYRSLEVVWRLRNAPKSLCYTCVPESEWFVKEETSLKKVSHHKKEPDSGQYHYHIYHEHLQGHPWTGHFFFAHWALRLTVVGAPLRPSESDLGRNWKSGEDSASFQMILGCLLSCAWITDNPHTAQSLINQSSYTGEHVEIKWSDTTWIMGWTSPLTLTVFNKEVSWFEIIWIEL
jgi:hypothetical protein